MMLYGEAHRPLCGGGGGLALASLSKKTTQVTAVYDSAPLHRVNTSFHRCRRSRQPHRRMRSSIMGALMASPRKALQLLRPALADRAITLDPTLTPQETTRTRMDGRRCDRLYVLLRPAQQQPVPTGAVGWDTSSDKQPPYPLVGASQGSAVYCSLRDALP